LAVVGNQAEPKPKQTMKTNKAKTYRCCECNGKGMVPGFSAASADWKTCQACNGLGRGEHGYRILQSRQQSDGRYAVEEIIGYPGRIHATSMTKAQEFATHVVGISCTVQRVE